MAIRKWVVDAVKERNIKKGIPQAANGETDFERRVRILNEKTGGNYDKPTDYSN